MLNVKQITIDEATQHAQLMIEAATDRADREYSGWSSLAYAFLRHFVRDKKNFWPWELIQASIDFGLVQPQNLRAWGGVYQRASREKLIIRGSKLGKHPNRHGTLVPIWDVVQK